MEKAFLRGAHWPPLFLYLFWSPPFPLTAELQCLCLSQSLICTKPELKEDGRRTQLKSPWAKASILHATRTFIYHSLLQIWPCPVWMQGPQTIVWTPRNSSITHANLKTTWTLSRQKKQNMSVTKQTYMSGSRRIKQSSAVCTDFEVLFYCFIVYGDNFIAASWFLGFFIYTGSSFQFVQTITSSIVLLYFAETCDCVLGRAFGRRFKLLTCRCVKHYCLLRHKKSNTVYR